MLSTGDGVKKEMWDADNVFMCKMCYKPVTTTDVLGTSYV